MWYDSTRSTVHFKAYRVPVRCWRCWKRFEFFAPYDFVDMLLFPCDRCSATRALGAYGERNYGGAEGKYLDLHHPSLRREDETKKHMNEFLPMFENHWVTESCSCGGRFRLRAPIRCPHCRAPEYRLLRGRDEIVETPPIPVLKFTIPPEYQNIPARPSWKPQENRNSGGIPGNPYQVRKGQVSDGPTASPGE